jgi:hypothetical protein
MQFKKSDANIFTSLVDIQKYTRKPDFQQALAANRTQP